MRTEDQVAAMQCPVCRVPLAMSAREGIEIDYCPQCRGVWLDRGELDKIVERSVPQAAPEQAPQSPPPRDRQEGAGGWNTGSNNSGSYEQDRQGHGGYRGKPPRKRKSFLEELFD